jgi:hypothetical protein
MPKERPNNPEQENLADEIEENEVKCKANQHVFC